MNSSQLNMSISATQLTALAKALQFAAADPAFMARLTSMVEQQERAVDAKVRRDAAVERIRTAPDCRESQALARLAASKGRLHYSGYAWVPDEYETLERLQLVSCEFGCTDRSGLRTRTIHLTQQGQEVLSTMRLAIDSALV